MELFSVSAINMALFQSKMRELGILKLDCEHHKPFNTNQKSVVNGFHPQEQEKKQIS